MLCPFFVQVTILAVQCCEQAEESVVLQLWYPKDSCCNNPITTALVLQQWNLLLLLSKKVTASQRMWRWSSIPLLDLVYFIIHTIIVQPESRISPESLSDGTGEWDLTLSNTDRPQQYYWLLCLWFRKSGLSLSIIDFGLFEDSQSLISQQQFWRCCTVIVAASWSGWKESYKPVSSANSWQSVPYFAMIIPSCVMYRENRNQLRIDPCGTPQLSHVRTEEAWLIVTCWNLSSGYSWNHSWAVPLALTYLQKASLSAQCLQEHAVVTLYWKQH